MTGGARGPAGWAGALLAALVLLLAGGMLSLGVWQLDRLQARRAENAAVRARLAQPPLDLNAAPDARLPEYTPVQATGIYDFAAEIVLRNRAYRDSPGVHVLTPLRLANSDQAVLVDRGWIPYTEAEPAPRAAFQTPAGVVSVTGVARASQPRSRPFLPADPTLSPEQPRLDAWFWLDLDQIQAQMPYPLLPFYLEAAPAESANTLPISGYSVDLTDGAHFTYAIQWFAFTTILLIGSAALWRQTRRGGGRRAPPRPPAAPAGG